MNIDEKIKQALGEDAARYDDILNNKPGMFSLVMRSYQGGMGVWMWLVTGLIFAITGLMVWTGYRFINAPVVDERVYWGVWFTMLLLLQLGLKLWTWMEVHRNSVLREIKRLEIAVRTLADKSPD